MIASLPSLLDPALVARFLPAEAAVRFATWDLVGDPMGADAGEIDVIVTPFHTSSLTPNPGYVGLADIAAALTRAPRTRLVQLPSIGYEGVPELLPPGCVLANAAGVMEGQTAELALTLLLASVRGIPDFVDAAPKWANSRMPGLLGRHVVVLGYGGVGREILRRLAPFDARVTPVARTARVDASGDRPVDVLGLDALQDAVSDATALICALPLTDETRGLIGVDLLSRLPDGATVVNVGRGPVVDTSALIAELRSGRLRAALDVTDPEPLPPEHELWRLPQTLITPHVGGNTPAMLGLLHRLVADQLALIQSGGKPRNLVDAHPTEASA
ncbi:NAD(P)-dependent oxidoreductase [Microbacterium indicum]|uniref:NAD(P)-dependent oxidoreductase n=1 Tax=Microbacterium indicum TaxID=358100 RepID=UPI000421A5AA|nr:NAD(P)-dependent oxidoreductase [Microbacterium indicum]